MMKFRTCAIALAALFATALAADRGLADTDCTPEMYPIEGCTSNQQISVSDATCVSVSRKEEVRGAFTFNKVAVENACSTHGNIVARVNVTTVTGTSGGAKMCVSATRQSMETTSPISGIYCCFEGEGDLCWKDQVVANADGNIKRRSVSSPSTSTEHAVGTHRQRYDFCQEHPDDVYCDVNPSGDAKLDPDGGACGTGNQLACNCGDHFCTVADCDWHFEQGGTKDECANREEDPRSSYAMSISAIDGSSQTCTLSTICKTGATDDDDNAVYKETTVSAEVWNMDDLNNCNGELQLDECG